MCPRCSSSPMQRMTEQMDTDQAFWCTTCSGWITHELRNGRLYIEFADWRSRGRKETRETC